VGISGENTGALLQQRWGQGERKTNSSLLGRGVPPAHCFGRSRRPNNAFTGKNEAPWMRKESKPKIR